MNRLIDESAPKTLFEELHPNPEEDDGDSDAETLLKDSESGIERET